MVQSVWFRRARWRIRGAWQWPAFAVLTAIDAVLLARLPFQGVGADALGAMLLAGVINLFAVALLAPPVGVLLRRRRRDLPRFIARDYAGTTLLVTITLALLAGGLAHRTSASAERADRRAVFAAVHDYVISTAPAFATGLGTIDTSRLEDEHYRACIYGPEKRPLCLFVNTDQTPAGVKRDPSRDPNDLFHRGT